MRTKAGFTRVELLAVLVVLAALAMLGRPAGARSKSSADLAACMNNVRQLAQAWTTFAVDRNDTFAGTVHGGEAQNPFPMEGPGASPQMVAWQPWGLGWMDWELSPANTNFALFASPRYGSVANYVGQKKELFKCPAEGFLSRPQRISFRERVRSYSANIGVGDGNAETGPWNQAYLHVRKFSELVNPTPGLAYVFLEEHPDSMNECAFFSPFGTPNALSAVDIPGSHHDGAATFSFADGRVESHRWLGASRNNPVRYVFNGPSYRGTDPDLRYLYDRTPRRAGL